MTAVKLETAPATSTVVDKGTPWNRIVKPLLKPQHKPIEQENRDPPVKQENCALPVKRDGGPPPPMRESRTQPVKGVFPKIID